MNRLFRWGILIALVILIGSSLMAIRIIFVDDNEIEVPAVVGLSAIDATSRLQNAGLSARIDQVDSDQPEGTVTYQGIAAGERVDKGKIVNIKVSRGGTQIQLPDVRGMEFAAAVRTLDAAGLKLGNVLRVPDALKPAGSVIAQNPSAPATVLNTQMVELLVSEGKSGKAETIQVPDLKGQDEALARQVLQQSDLSVSRVILQESNLVPPGSIVRTQPRAGSRVPFGGQVILYVAKAPDPNTTPPDPTVVVPQATPPPTAPPPGAVTSTTQTPTASGATSTTGVISTSGPMPTTATTPPVTTTPGTGATTVPVVVPPAASSGRTAKIRYQVPPLSRPLQLKISITDQSGVRVLRDQQSRGGEYLTFDVPYSGSANVTVHLGGELVWQERYE